MVMAASRQLRKRQDPLSTPQGADWFCRFPGFTRWAQRGAGTFAPVLGEHQPERFPNGGPRDGSRPGTGVRQDTGRESAQNPSNSSR
ncbi:hypothetical protein GCM10010406_25910 [Streptomyces thermolineatus]|uniref:Transposase n=1 Tax=Streptomyces thermolineatus TaxID=44033 RepID=A0ABN3LT65_9ACTN